MNVGSFCYEGMTMSGQVEYLLRDMCTNLR